MQANHLFKFNPDSFTEEQRAVLTLLAEGASVTAAARVRGIHRTTIHHWMRRTPGYRAAVLSAREEACARRREQLLDATHAAIDYLHKTITDEKAPHSVRTRIAFALLKLRVVNGSMLETATYGQTYIMPMPQEIHKIKDTRLRKQAENSLAGVLSRRNQRADYYEYPRFESDQRRSSNSSHPSRKPVKSVLSGLAPWRDEKQVTTNQEISSPCLQSLTGNRRSNP